MLKHNENEEPVSVNIGDGYDLRVEAVLEYGPKNGCARIRIGLVALYSALGFPGVGSWKPPRSWKRLPETDLNFRFIVPESDLLPSTRRVTIPVHTEVRV